MPQIFWEKQPTEGLGMASSGPGWGLNRMGGGDMLRFDLPAVQRDLLEDPNNWDMAYSAVMPQSSSGFFDNWLRRQSGRYQGMYLGDLGKQASTGAVPDLSAGRFLSRLFQPAYWQTPQNFYGTPWWY